jgi:hypothetical protein
MNHLRNLSLVVTTAAFSTLGHAQSPAVTVDGHHDGNLAAAQSYLAQAYARMSEAQKANDSRLGEHAARVKQLLEQANQEIELAAQQGDANRGDATPVPAMSANLAGKWIIFAYNVSQPGSSLKTVQLFQEENILTGTFQDLGQKGKLQGWISGNHVEFSTDTHDVLTFRGEITPTCMSGLCGVNGEHARWVAQRS